jgi:hypothetical protein
MLQQLLVDVQQPRQHLQGWSKAHTEADSHSITISIAIPFWLMCKQTAREAV